MTTGPVELRGPERRRGLLAIWVAIAALLATAVFGLATVGDEPSGSSDPKDAVTKLMRAANDSDVLGALEAVVPSERTIVRGPLVDMVNEAKRLGLLDKADLDHVDGVDFDFADVKMTTTTLTSSMAAVRVVGGKLTSVLDPKRLPLGPTLTDAGVDVRSEPADTETTDLATSPFELVTVKRDGTWYVSIAYSIAEAMRKDAGAALPDFGKGIAAKGETTPRLAVAEALRAGLSFDIERVIALVSPGEGDALRDYAPLFLSDAKAMFTDAKKSFSATIANLDVSSEESGNTARVTIDKFDVTMRTGGDSIHMVFDGDCTTVTAPGERPQKTCAKDALKTIPFFDSLPKGAGVSKLTFTAVKADGAWFISPTRTVTSLILDATKPLDRKSLADLIKSFQEGFSSFSEEGTAINEA